MTKITIHGDEITDKPLKIIKSFLKDATTLTSTVLLGTVFVAAAIEHVTPHQIISEECAELLHLSLLILANRLSMNVPYNLSMNVFHNRPLFETFPLKGADKCINKDPVENSNPNYSLRRTANVLAMWSAIRCIAAVETIYANSDSYFRGSTFDVVSKLSSDLITLSYFLPAFIRWNKVAQGKWTLEEMPPPSPKEEPKPSFVQRLMPKAALQM